MIADDIFRDEIISFYTSLGYKKNEPASIVSSSFPDTYNPSGAHDLVVNLLSQNSRIYPHQKYVGIDPCYRHIDLPLAGQPWYSSFFEMFTYVDAYPREDINIFQANKMIVSLLVDHFGLSSRKFIITYFGGGCVKGKQMIENSEAKEAWLELGFTKKQIFSIQGKPNFLYTESDGDGAGPRCELFYEYKEDTYIELATVIYETHRLVRKELELTRNCVTGSGIGFERLMAVVNGTFDIFQSDKYQRYLSVIKENLNNKKMELVFNYELRRLVSLIRSLVIISSGGEQKKKKHKLNTLIRETHRVCEKLNLNISNVVKVLFDEIYVHDRLYLKDCNSDSLFKKISVDISNINVEF